MIFDPHRRAISRLSVELRHTILDYFKLPRVRDHLADVLPSVGLGQADLVLCLLRVNTREARRLVERVVGKPILVCPPCLRHARRPPPPVLAGPRVTYVGPNLFGGGRRDRFAMLRPGMTVSQYISRGGNHRDLRVARKRGLLRIAS